MGVKKEGAQARQNLARPTRHSEDLPVGRITARSKTC